LNEVSNAYPLPSSDVSGLVGKLAPLYTLISAAIPGPGPTMMSSTPSRFTSAVTTRAPPLNPGPAPPYPGYGANAASWVNEAAAWTVNWVGPPGPLPTARRAVPGAIGAGAAIGGGGAAGGGGLVLWAVHPMSAIAARSSAVGRIRSPSSMSRSISVRWPCESVSSTQT
jgi:hypothetical protein